MNITLENLSLLFKKYGDSISIKYFDDVILKGTCYLSSDILLPDHLHVLSENKRDTIEIFYDSGIYRLLCDEFPEEYRRAHGRFSMTEVDKYLEELKDASATSRRKRFIFAINEFYGIDPDRGRKTISIANNEPIDYKKWNLVKRNIDKGQYLYYRNSETKIIVCVDMAMRADAPYIDRFRVNIDLISLLVSMTPDNPDYFAPDYNPTTDVVSVTDPESLLEEYIKTNARMIIIGEKLNEAYKKGLMEVIKYDKYVRMLVVPALDLKNKDHFLRQVKLVYNSNKW